MHVLRQVHSCTRVTKDFCARVKRVTTLVTRDVILLAAPPPLQINGEHEWEDTGDVLTILSIVQCQKRPSIVSKET
jgi:hypothetical protein